MKLAIIALTLFTTLSTQAANLRCVARAATLGEDTYDTRFPDVVLTPAGQATVLFGELEVGGADNINATVGDFPTYISLTATFGWNLIFAQTFPTLAKGESMKVRVSLLSLPGAQADMFVECVR